MAMHGIVSDDDDESLISQYDVDDESWLVTTLSIDPFPTRMCVRQALLLVGASLPT